MVMAGKEDVLRGKTILVVDDEFDVLEFLEERLEDCIVEKATTFDSAKNLLENKPYDAAVLDIMGVRGFDLLEIAVKRNIPSLMLTAHSLNPESLVGSIKLGAKSYVPKDKISEIDAYLNEILLAKQKGLEKSGSWFRRLSAFFNERFGPGWKDKDKEFWKDFHQDYGTTKEELRDVL
jgi:DNA-binding response OmpR family regulator